MPITKEEIKRRNDFIKEKLTQAGLPPMLKDVLSRPFIFYNQKRLDATLAGIIIGVEVFSHGDLHLYVSPPRMLISEPLLHLTFNQDKDCWYAVTQKGDQAPVQHQGTLLVM